MSGPPSECPPQKTFRRRTARLGISLVITAFQSRTVCSTPTFLSQLRVRGALPAAEGHPVDRAAAPVVVERDLRVAGPGGGPQPAVVLEAVRAAVERPELHVLPAGAHRADEVARELVEGPGSAEEAGHGGDHGVGVGRVARAVRVAEAQVAHPVARLGMGARGRGQRRLHAHVGLGHLLGVGRRGGHPLLGAVRAEACGRSREHDRGHHGCETSCPGPHGAGS